MLSLSVPQLVKMISSGSAPRSAATSRARFLELHGHLAAEGVHAGGIAVVLPEVGEHGLHDFRRNPARGVVVEIDGLHHDSSSTDEVRRNRFPQLRFHEPLEGHLGGVARGAAASCGHDHPVADHVDQIHVAAVVAQGRPDLPLQHVFDELDLLEVRQFRLSFRLDCGRTRSRATLSMMARILSWQFPQPPPAFV